MKKILTIVLASLALNGFAQSENHGLSIVGPIPPEKVMEYEMQVVIYNEATRANNYDIKKLTDTGWYVHSILPFGWRLSGAASSAYKEDLLIVYIRPRNAMPKKDTDTGKESLPSKK
jgi:hypothetical protein